MKNYIESWGQTFKNRDFRKFLDIGVFYMSSISAMGPHFFHWKNKLWVRGGRSRLALSENIENYFFEAVNDRLIPSKPANLRDPYKIRFRTRDQGPGTRDQGPKKFCKIS